RRGPAHRERGPDPRAADHQACAEGAAGRAACAPAAARRVAPAHLPPDPAGAAGSRLVQGHQHADRAGAVHAGVHHPAGRQAPCRVRREARRAGDALRHLRERRHRLCAGARSRRAPRRPSGRPLRRRRLHPSRGAQAARAEGRSTHSGRRAQAGGDVRRRRHPDLRRAVDVTTLRLAFAAGTALAMFGTPGEAAETEALELKLSYELQSVEADPGALARFVPLEVSINGAGAGNWVLMEREGVLYAPLDAFQEWRLNRDPRARSLSYRGEDWYPLSSLPGYTARFNPAEQSLPGGFATGAFRRTPVRQPAAA